MKNGFERIPLGELATFKTGKLDSNAAVEGGEYPFFTCSRETFRTSTFSFDDEVVLLAGNNAAGIYPLKYFKGKFDVYQRTYVIRPIDSNCLNTRFLYFALRPLLEHLRDISTGAATKFLTMGLLTNLELSVPDLPTQRKIAGILSAYDDLIENNLRRIRILEEMAQSLYREWFVHFRFPGHESTRLVDSPLGPIPEGWKVKSMPEAIEVRPKVPVPKDVEIPFIPMASLSETSMLIGEVEIRPKASGARFQNGDTLFARITPCLENGKTGYVQFLPDDETVACGSTEFIVLRSKSVSPEYVYLMARSEPFRENAIKSMSGATGRQRVREECFEQFLLVQPPAGLLTRFQAVTGPQFQLIYSLNRRTETLRQTRELLLPKLLSGQITLDVVQSDAPETIERPAPPRPVSRASSPVAITTTPQRTITAARKTDSPPPIDEIDRTEVLCAIRKLFNDGGWRDRETTLKELSAALGYRRLGPHIREVLSTDLLTAVRRGILTSESGVYALAFRSVTELPRDILKDRFLTAIGRPWITRHDATRTFARSLGYARNGEQINHTARSLINGLLREGRLESDGEFIRRG